jgi:hypothetical protein
MPTTLRRSLDPCVVEALTSSRLDPRSTTTVQVWLEERESGGPRSLPPSSRLPPAGPSAAQLERARRSVEEV